MSSGAGCGCADVLDDGDGDASVSQDGVEPVGGLERVVGEGRDAGAGAHRHGEPVQHAAAGIGLG